MAGFEVQALGICEALGLTPDIKRVKPGAPHRWIAPWGPAAPAEGISPPWPDLLIASGRQSIPYARMIRRKSGGKTFVAVLQDPKVSPAQFDFVWAPAHDRLEGENVLSTLTSPHRLTREKLEAEAARIEPQVAHLPHPRVAVLLGGSNAVYTFSEETAQRVGAQLAGLADHFHAGLMVTPSRRTGTAQSAIIREALKDKPALMWDGTGENPYFGFLGSADAIVVTCDSVNMVGEAASTGKPVYIIELEGGSPKFRRFLDGMYAHGAARPFAGQLESWGYEPLNATHEIAEAIACGLAARRGSGVDQSR
ncbi:mitochondrial fission ELM1 family protein [Parvibaculum sp.]|uniref:mitochondrial fission ELM1 family protein n=1 Tax=Parvibaculum sp. TaxID=2024848 RepID=UPI002BDFDA6C|nr:mitochondrial fission ELM1 family protein [Parvibaculum sp.]HUD50321.1 mitochondrial fission ELM1 family protein [Parvibaculum sp.]